MANGQQSTYDLSSVAQDPGFINASAQDKIAYLSAHDADFAKASPTDKAGYLNHILGYDKPSSVERQAQGLTQDQQEAAYSRAYANERARGGLVLSDADVATIGLGGIGAGRSIATQGLKVAAKGLARTAVGGAVGATAGGYAGREVGGVFGKPEEGRQIGAGLGGLAGSFVGGLNPDMLPSEGRLGAVFNRLRPQEPAFPGASLPSTDEFYARRGAELNSMRKLQPGAFAPPGPELGSPENPGFYAKLPTRMPKPASAVPPRPDPFAGAISSNAALPDRPLPSAGAYAPPSANVPGVSRVPAPIKTSPFGNATPSNALNADIPLPRAGAYNPPSAEVPGVSSPYTPPTGIKGSIAKPSGRLILSPEEARAESAMQDVATRRAKQHGMLYAAGMRPAGGGRVPVSATPTETFEYPGARSAYDPPDAQYSPTGGAEGPYSPPSYAYRVHDADVGPEELDLSRSHAHATMSPEEATAYQATRNPGTPQAISKTDLSGLKEGVDYKLMAGPNGSKWVKYLTARAKDEFLPHE